MIKIEGKKHLKFNFPAGEMHIKVLEGDPHENVSILFEFERNEDLVELLWSAMRSGGKT